MTFLEDILSRKREEVAARRRARPLDALVEEARGVPKPRPFGAALSPFGGPLRVIAEVKRASPSVGGIRPSLDPAALATCYANAGAAAISVLTDGPGFGGSLSDLVAVRAAVSVPLLRKDFVVDAYQLAEARAHGADAVLLIVAALPAQLPELLAASAELGLEALTEVHDQRELDLALAAGARLVGINNRDLNTFRVDLATCETLLPRVPKEVKAVAESGVKGPPEAARLRQAGAANLLVGEALVRAADPAALLRALG